jgi:GrpB-like predicted nucleotidyltransferase (UPF0157 family)
VDVDPAFVERIVSSPAESDAAWIDGPPTLVGSVVVLPHDPRWPGVYRREARKIRGLLGSEVLSLEHVGSTAVPGLAAKPIIDIDLVVASSADELAYVPVLQSAGYALVIREPNWHEHRMLTRADPDVNLHVFSPGSPETHRHVVFRDWLRAHDDDRDLYGRTKLELASRAWADVRGYTDAKDHVIDQIYARAFGVDS